MWFWVDKDQTSTSRRLLSKFEGSPYFKVVGSGFSDKAGEKAIELDQADLTVELLSGFEKMLFRDGEATIKLEANAIDGIKGSLSIAYSQAVIREYNQQLLSERAAITGPQAGISITSANWYNPKMDYKTFMVPGILALLVTMIGAFLSSMNVVREREIGTIEQLNVTPIKKYQFIVGKLLPFWILGLFELTIGLVIAKVLYNIPFLGGLEVLYGFSAIYLLAILGLGLLVSTMTETQQQAMFISWFLLVIFLFLSGMFTAIENMPPWAQKVTYLNPIRYFMEIIRMVMLKGAGWAEIQSQMIIMIGFAVGLNGLAVWRYRKTV